jgi:hypothetical protein
MPALFTGMKSLPVGLQDISLDIRSTGIALAVISRQRDDLLLAALAQ